MLSDTPAYPCFVCLIQKMLYWFCILEHSQWPANALRCPCTPNILPAWPSGRHVPVTTWSALCATSLPGGRDFKTFHSQQSESGQESLRWPDPLDNQPAGQFIAHLVQRPHNCDKSDIYIWFSLHTICVKCYLQNVYEMTLKNLKQ